MEKLKDLLLEAFIVVAAVGLYFVMPNIFKLIAKYSRGIEGLVFQLIMAILLGGLYYLMGYRQKSLAYVFLLILFVCIMIWIYFNYRNLDVIISNRYGQGAAMAVFVLIIILVCLISRLLI